MKTVYGAVLGARTKKIEQKILSRVVLMKLQEYGDGNILNQRSP